MSEKKTKTQEQKPAETKPPAESSEKNKNKDTDHSQELVALQQRLDELASENKGYKDQISKMNKALKPEEKEEKKEDKDPVSDAVSKALEPLSNQVKSLQQQLEEREHENALNEIAKGIGLEGQTERDFLAFMLDRAAAQNGGKDLSEKQIDSVIEEVKKKFSKTDRSGPSSPSQKASPISHLSQSDQITYEQWKGLDIMGKNELWKQDKRTSGAFETQWLDEQSKVIPETRYENKTRFSLK